MLIKTEPQIPSSEITKKSDYLGRRDFLKAAGMTAAGLAVGSELISPTRASAGTKLEFRKSDLSTHGEALTPLKDITSYNNFYEFGTDKGDPAVNAHTLKPYPWNVTIGGLVKKPQKVDVESIKKLAPLEERVYRMRCVEGWSMVIPWIGIPLNALLKSVEPLPKAKYVAFETLYDP